MGLYLSSLQSSVRHLDRSEYTALMLFKPQDNNIMFLR